MLNYNPNKATYTGHLPNGNPVQAHSADHYYAVYGIVMICRESANGKGRLWQATKDGKVIFSHPKHNAARDGAVMLLNGAGNFITPGD